MTTFNKPVKNRTETRNHEGAVAYKLTPELELYTLVVTSMFSDKFYESSDDRVERLRTLIAKVKPEFVAKLAVYAREKMYLRTIPLVLVVELAKIHNGDNLISKTVERIVQRVDEITELLSYYAIANGRTEIKKLGQLSKQIEKGLAKAILKFDEYQLAKYDRKGEIKLRDAFFVVRPTPTSPEQKDMWDRLEKGLLKTPYTWETELSEKGNKPEVWQELIDSKRFPYMAAMRNLRNILNAGVDKKHVSEVASMLANPDNVAKSKQLPFRYLSAYKEILENDSPQTSMILNALESAIQASAQNVKGFDYNQTIAIACDVSGSMETGISEKSKIQNFDIGLLLGMILQHRCKSVVSGIFGDSFKIINLPQTGILENVMELHRREGEVGYSTNGYLVLKELRKKKIDADKVMIFTDCQMWNSSSGWGEDSGDTFQAEWNAYKKEFPNAKLYLFDMSGYGSIPVSMQQKDVYLIAGWSDKVFDVLSAFEEGDSAIQVIENTVI